MSLVKFIRGVTSALSGKSIKDGQILFDETTHQLMVDKKPEGQTGSRITVKSELENALDGETILLL